MSRIDELILDLEAVNYELGYEDMAKLHNQHKVERRDKIREALKQAITESKGGAP